jgi:hypothetical protein
MKKYLAILLLALSVPAFAQHHGHGHYGHHGYWHRGGNNWVWVAPTIIGGVIGYEIARNQPSVVVQQPPVVIQQQTAQTCSPWTEIQNPDGTITRTRTCSQ